MLPDGILAAIMTMLAIEIGVCWNMLISVDVLISSIQCKFSVAVG
jgi:hypothetical protein